MDVMINFIKKYFGQKQESKSAIKLKPTMEKNRHEFSKTKILVDDDRHIRETTTPLEDQQRFGVYIWDAICPHQIKMRHLSPHKKEWIVENLEGIWYHNDKHVGFNLVNDALLFKFRWLDNL